MATQWVISTLERELSDGGVTVAHWRATDVDGDYKHIQVEHQLT